MCALLVVAVLPSCNLGEDDRKAAPEEEAPPAGTALDDSEGHTTHYFGTAGEAVFLYAADMLTAKEDLVLVSAAPTSRPSAVEFLGARVVFHRSLSPARPSIGGGPAGLCASKYPPPGFGPTYPVRGTAVTAGEKFSVLFFIRARRGIVGDLRTRGLRVTYRAGSEFTHQTDGTEVVMYAQKSLDDLPDDSKHRRCPIRDGEGWFLPYQRVSSSTATSTTDSTAST